MIGLDDAALVSRSERRDHLITLVEFALAQADALGEVNAGIFLDRTLVALADPTEV